MTPGSTTAGSLERKHLSQAHKAAWDRTVAPAGSTLDLPRLLMVVAHPDDEVLAMGARLERLSGSRIVTVTDGAPADSRDALQHGFPSLAAYRHARQAELLAALAHAQLLPGVVAPFQAMPAVPDQRAGYHLEELTLGLLSVLEDFAPEAVLTHPYEGGHPDHDACAFAVHLALHLLQSRDPNSSTTGPLLIEAPFYHNNGSGGLRTGTFLPAKAAPALTLRLSPSEKANKAARLACFASQAETLNQFSTDQEVFRLAPAYDFTQPPHAGKLLYEHFSWGMTGDRFCSRAAEAQQHLLGGVSHADAESLGRGSR